MKRHNFAGGYKSHGNSVSHRAPGSIGQRQTPGRVFLGKRMSGHMGVDNITTENLKVVEVDLERNLLLIRGAVPGSEGGNVFVRPSVACGAQGEARQARAQQEVSAHETQTRRWLGHGPAGFRSDLRRDYNEALVHQVVTAYRNAGRSGTKAQKTKAEVRAAARSRMRRRARARRARARAAARSGRRRRNLRGEAPELCAESERKMYQGAIRSMLSELVRQERLVVADKIELDAPRRSSSPRSSRAGRSTTC